MKLHFDPNQQYQIDAINSIVDLFEGQPLNKSDYEFSLSPNSGYMLSENGVGNGIVLEEAQILANLQAIQRKNGLKEAEYLQGLNFSVEMETGTGKTYVYLRTIYELNKRYGFKKFIIVVPSIAIREGVIKNLEITHDHFQSLYEKQPATFNVYDPGKISLLRNFALNNNIQILVINIDSFAKDVNVINKFNDKLTGKKPIEFIQATNPIVIVDEPQNMETEIRKKAIDNLNPACTLRYSATHANLYNLVYSLNPVKAYDLGLVKQIEVDSIFAENSSNQAFLKVEDIKAKKTKTLAKISLDTLGENGIIRKTVNVEVGDDLYEKSNKRELYREGYIINAIDVGEGKVELSNGEILAVGEQRGGLLDEVMKVQIRKTVEEHFQKEKKYKEKGIKVLSLIFIDRVANYRSYDEAGNPAKGKFALWFEEIFKEIAGKKEYQGVIPFQSEVVHNGYFAQDKKGIFKDSSESRETLADDDTYRLIMKDKERLLDINNPLRFIFSHSALREGWDSPNVFQICTLNETRSEMKKRQEIGRGLRLCVDQQGDRIQDKNTNRLTVIANESYEEFAAELQKEMEEDCGVEFKERIRNKNERVKVRLRKNYQFDEKFKELWDKIKHKTTYNIDFDTEKLIEASVKEIKNMPAVRKPIIKYVKTGMQVVREGLTGVQKGVGITQVENPLFDVPDVLGYIQSRTELTRSTILRILKGSGRLVDILRNPQMFMDMATAEIKNVLAEMIVDGIKYEKINGIEYEMRLFEDNEVEAYRKNLYQVSKQDKTIANYISIDSMSEPEKRFASDCETNDNVEFYIKLPAWFKIKTPLGSYNPDWALIFKGEKKLYFVAETKSTREMNELYPEERMKIKCGEAHFKEFKDVEYKVVTKVEDLL